MINVSKIYILLILIVLSFSSVSANSKELKQANNLMLRNKFEQAIPILNDALVSDAQNANVNFKLGLCYYNLYNYDNALNCFEIAKTNTTPKYDFYNLKEDKAPVDVFYYLAECYLQIEQTDRALEYYNKYNTAYQNAPPINVVEKINTCYNVVKFSTKPLTAKRTPLNKTINSTFDEMHPIMSWDESYLYFASNKEGNNSIYQSKWQSNGKWGPPAKLPFCSAKDEYPVYVSKNNKTFYFCRKHGEVYNIYTSKNVDGKWEKETPLNEVNTEFNETGLCISLNGRHMFISSDRNGNSDIFKLSKKSDGSWSIPEAVETVNTEFNESYPFMGADNISLFFSSDNPYTGMGNSDLYFTQQNESGQWLKPVNLGSPVNSPGNEFAYNSSISPKLAYFTVLNGNNGYDIFKLEGLSIDSLVAQSSFQELPPQNKAVDEKIEKLISEIESSSIEKSIEIVNGLDKKTAGTVMQQVEIEKAVEVMDGIETEKAIEIFDDVPIEKAIDFSNEMKSDKTSAVVSGVEREKAIEVVENIEVEKSVDLFKTIELEKSIEILQDVEPVKSAQIMDNIEIEKAIGVVENMEMEKSVEIFNNMEIEKSIEIAEKVNPRRSTDLMQNAPIEKAIDLMGGMNEAKAVEIIQGIEIEKAVEVMGGLEKEKGKKIVEQLQAKIEHGDNAKIIALLKKYFAGQIREKETYTFKQVYFDFNSAALNLMSKQELLMLVQFLEENAFVKVEVVGHTDIKGDWDVNLKVSSDRAKVVYDFLRKNNIAHDRIIFYGKGSAQPIASNETEVGRKLNRRVEVILMQ